MPPPQPGIDASPRAAWARGEAGDARRRRGRAPLVQPMLWPSFAVAGLGTAADHLLVAWQQQPVQCAPRLTDCSGPARARCTGCMSLTNLPAGGHLAGPVL